MRWQIVSRIRHTIDRPRDAEALAPSGHCPGRSRRNGPAKHEASAMVTPLTENAGGFRRQAHPRATGAGSSLGRRHRRRRRHGRARAPRRRRGAADPTAPARDDRCRPLPRSGARSQPIPRHAERCVPLRHGAVHLGTEHRHGRARCGCGGATSCGSTTLVRWCCCSPTARRAC